MNCKNKTMLAALLSSGALSFVALRGMPSETPAVSAEPSSPLASACTAASVQSMLNGLDVRATTGKIPDHPGPFFADGTKFTAAQGRTPAYCQVTGSYVTNPATGKTSNFLATFPENWNGKYLQVGCSGHCGTFAVSNPAMFTITITNQGLPGDILRKGYATFATDEGHTVMTGGTWAIKGPGQVDDDAITDFLWRSSKVLTQFGKQFTRAFYARTSGQPATISRSYFGGCSGGGRDALVAASYFPEEFDGIVAGSPYYPTGRAFHAVATATASLRAPDAFISRPLLALFNQRVTGQCDALDGVKDGLIQNPAACNFRPERDLPLCQPGQSGDQCFTRAQEELLAVTLSAVTDENGRMVQPGYSVSNLGPDFSPPAKPADPASLDPWPDNMAQGGLWSISNAAIKVIAHRNDPAFSSRSIVSFRSGGPGPINGFSAVVPSSEVDFVTRAWRAGTGHLPENFTRFIASNRKLLIWHNLSDEKLTPYNSINFYKQLAARNGGYGRLQNSVRLFGLPGTGHCSGGQQAGPGSFDALTAIENWVEKGQAPEALIATAYQPTPLGNLDFTKPLGRTMPLCKFPEMARYKGKGDVRDAASWECQAGDRRMLRLGESGRRAGVLR